MLAGEGCRQAEALAEAETKSAGVSDTADLQRLTPNFAAVPSTHQAQHNLTVSEFLRHSTLEQRGGSANPDSPISGFPA